MLLADRPTTSRWTHPPSSGGRTLLLGQADPRRQEPRPTLRPQDTSTESIAFGARPRFSPRPYANRRPRRAPQIQHRDRSPGMRSRCAAGAVLRRRAAGFGRQQQRSVPSDGCCFDESPRRPSACSRTTVRSSASAAALRLAAAPPRGAALRPTRRTPMVHRLVHRRVNSAVRLAQSDLSFSSPSRSSAAVGHEPGFSCG